MTDVVSNNGHYVGWDQGAGLVEAFATGPVVMVASHAEYGVEVPLSDVTRSSLVTDLRQGG